MIPPPTMALPMFYGHFCRQILEQTYLASLIKSKPYFKDASSCISVMLQQLSTIAELIMATEVRFDTFSIKKN